MNRPKWRRQNRHGKRGEIMRELINDILSEFTELSGEYIEAKKEDVLNRLCAVLSEDKKDDRQ